MTEINLKELARSCVNTEESRSKFCHLIIKLKTPHVTVLLYKNGKFIITGIKSYEEIESALSKFYRLLLDKGIFFVARAWKLVNITVTGNQKLLISLIDFKKNNIRHVDYEPELFPACVYKFENKNAKALIFKSGKYIITGIKNFNEIEPLDTKLHQYVDKYKIK